MTKHQKRALFLAALIVCVCAAALFLRPAAKPYAASMVLACDALGFERADGDARVTLRAGATPDAREIRIRVEDANLQYQLDEIELSRVIGAELLFTLPADVLKDRHMDASRINPFDLLADASFDSYWTLLNIHLDD